MVPGLDSIPVRLIIPYTITPCVASGPTGEGSPVRVRPYSGFMAFSDLGTRHPNFLYGSAICLTFLSYSSPWSEGIALWLKALAPWLEASRSIIEGYYSMIEGLCVISYDEDKFLLEEWIESVKYLIVELLLQARAVLKSNRGCGDRATCVLARLTRKVTHPYCKIELDRGT